MVKTIKLNTTDGSVNARNENETKSKRTVKRMLFVSVVWPMNECSQE